MVVNRLIQHIFDLLAGHGVEEVRVNVHYLADALLEAYGEESRVNGMSVYLEREDELLGTAGESSASPTGSTTPSSSSRATR